MRLGHRQPVLLLLAISCLLFCCDPRSEAGGTALQSSAAGTLPAADTLLAAQYFQQAKALQLAASYDSSSHLFKLSAKEYQGHGYTRRRLFANDEVAYNLWKQGLLDSSRVVLTTALTVCVDSGYASDYVEAKLLKNLGVVAKKSGNPDSALTIYKKAIDILHNDSSEVYPLEGVLWGNVGNIHADRGLYDEALNNYEIANTVFLRITPDSLSEDLARNLRNIGRITLTLGSTQDAAEFYSQSLKIQKRLYEPNHSQIGNSYLLLGRINEEQGDYHRALDHYQYALNALGTGNTKNSSRIALINNYLGITYRKMRDFENADAMFEVAFKLLRTGNPLDKKVLAMTYGNLGELALAMGQNDSALVSFNKAMELFQNLYGRNYHSVAELQKLMAIAKMRQANYGESEIHLKQAMQIRRGEIVKNQNKIAELYVLHGELHDAKHNYKNAAVAYHEALEAYVGRRLDFYTVEFDSIVDNYSPIFLLKPLFAKAIAIYNYSRLDSISSQRKIAFKKIAHQANRFAIELIDRLRLTYGSDDSKFELLESYFQYYEQAIETAVELSELTNNSNYLYEAFTISEKSRAMVLLNVRKHRLALETSHLPDSLRITENLLRDKLNAYKDKIYYLQSQKEITDHSSLNYWKAKHFVEQESYDKLMRTIESKHPEYYKQKYDTKIATLKEIRSKILRENSLLFEYFSGEHRLYRFALTQDSFWCDRIAFVDNLDERVSSFRKSIVEFDFQSYAKLGYSLYCDLVKTEALNRGVQSIVVVPDGILSYLPFEALLNKRALLSEANYGELPYIVREISFGYLNSCTYLLTSTSDSSRNTVDSFVGFAPAVFQ